MLGQFTFWDMMQHKSYLSLVFAKVDMPELIHKEFSSVYLLIPLMMGVGVLARLYAPDALWVVTLLAVTCIAIARRFYLAQKMLLLLLALLVGYCSMYIKYELSKAPVLSEKTNVNSLCGYVLQITDSKSGKKLLLDNLDGIELNKVRIATNVDVSAVDIGDRICMAASLMPPPSPVLPEGFDFRIWAHFEKIGAIGYATSSISITQDAQKPAFTIVVNQIRQKIQRAIVALNDNKAITGIISALLIGDPSPIPKAEFDSIRAAGIAHIMAISGMHIVSIVLIVFWTTRMCLARIESLSSRYDVRKIAVLFALLISAIYLLLAGRPISAQRAFIMSCIGLVAIFMDRSPSPMRAIATAAIIILLVQPQSILSASFQMSFAAALCLVKAFELYTKTIGVAKNVLVRYVLGTIFSTLVAGLATAPFVIYHFNQFSLYTILTNVFAIPLTNFIILPLGLLSLLLMPFGLGNITLWCMIIPTKFLLWLATFVAALPGASFYVPSYSAIGIAAISLGMALLALMRTKLALVGILPLVLGVASNIVYFRGNDPVLMLDSTSKLLSIKSDGRYYFSSLSKGRFTRSVWQSKYNIKYPLKLSKSEYCNEDGVCNIVVNRRDDTHSSVMIVLGEASAVNEQSVCGKDIVIDLSEGRIVKAKGFEHCMGSEEKTLVDLDFLEKNGNFFLY